MADLLKLTIDGSIVLSMQMFVVKTFREIKIRTKMAPPAPQLWGEKHPWLAPNHKCQLKVPQSWGIRGRVCQSSSFSLHSRSDRAPSTSLIVVNTARLLLS
jgi:hypothetical protein